MSFFVLDLNTFGRELGKYIEDNTGRDVSELIRKFISNVTAQPIQTQSDNNEDHVAPVKGKCVREIKRKNGPEICDKPATNIVNGNYYCGTAKSGCYKIILGRLARNESISNTSSLNGSGSSSRSTKSTKSKVDKYKEKEKRTIDLVRSVAPKAEQITVTEINGHYIDKETRIILNLQTHTACGRLDKDNKTIHQLSTEEELWAETHNFTVEQRDFDQDDDDSSVMLLENDDKIVNDLPPDYEETDTDNDNDDEMVDDSDIGDDEDDE